MVVSGFRKGQFCPLAGGYIPFADTEAERKAAQDPRPSIEERYSSHEDYVNRVRSAAQQMVAKRLLLQDDAAKMIQQAEDSSIRSSSGERW
jgi:3-hydroxy-3-methylglutaryl CoA synthase